MGEMYVNGVLIRYDSEEDLRQKLNRAQRQATRQGLQDSLTAMRRLKGKRTNSRVREITA